MSILTSLNSEMGMASLEVAIILIGAFILGYLLSYEINKLERFHSTAIDTWPTDSTPLISHQKNTSQPEGLLIQHKVSSNDIANGITPRNLEHSLAFRSSPQNTSINHTFSPKKTPTNATQNNDDALFDKDILDDEKLNQRAFNNTRSSIEPLIHITANKTQPPKQDNLFNPLDNDTPLMNKTNTKMNANKKDDFGLIQGITKKIEQQLNRHNIHNFEQLYYSSAYELRNIMKKNNSIVHYIESWPMQAHLARQQKWKDLKQLQDQIASNT